MIGIFRMGMAHMPQSNADNIYIGKDEKPTERMEAILNLDLWIWLVFFWFAWDVE